MSVITLILFYTLALFVDNYGVTEGHSIKDFSRGFSALKQITNLRHGILPGTLWCGWGNIARENHELGTYKELDKCCRTHDHCEDSIKPKGAKYGLYNKYICRSSLCECELQFYDCLKQIHGFYAYAVRRIYFTKCKQCLRTFYDSQECINRGLDIIGEADRKGRRVFCAKFDQNSKWVHRYNFTSSESISEVSTWDNDEYSNGEFDDRFEDYANQQWQ